LHVLENGGVLGPSAHLHDRIPEKSVSKLEVHRVAVVMWKGRQN